MNWTLCSRMLMRPESSEGFTALPFHLGNCTGILFGNDKLSNPSVRVQIQQKPSSYLDCALSGRVGAVDESGVKARSGAARDACFPVVPRDLPAAIWRASKAANCRLKYARGWPSDALKQYGARSTRSIGGYCTFHWYSTSIGSRWFGGQRTSRVFSVYLMQCRFVCLALRRISRCCGVFRSVHIHL